MAIRKNYRKTKKRGGANAEDKETRKHWNEYVNNVLQQLESNEITFSKEELKDLFDIAIKYNVDENLIRRVEERVAARAAAEIRFRMAEKNEETRSAEWRNAANKGGGKRRNTRRHKKKSNQTHHKKRRRNSRKKNNTRRKR